MAHSRAGIPEAFTTLGTIQQLCYHLYSGQEEVWKSNSKTEYPKNNLPLSHLCGPISPQVECYIILTVHITNSKFYEFSSPTFAIHNSGSHKICTLVLTSGFKVQSMNKYVDDTKILIYKMFYN